MIQVNISQARQTLPALVNKVYQGEEFVIVKNKIPVAQLIPVTGKKISNQFRESGGKYLLNLAKRAEKMSRNIKTKAPTDLSARIDHYLYGKN